MIILPSLKYYQAYPEYLKARLASIKSGSAGSWRILAVLCLIDALVKHHTTDVCIQQITSLLYKHQVTLILAWRPFDAARYIETFKIYENKAPDPIMESKIKDDPLSQVNDSYYILYYNSIGYSISYMYSNDKFY